MKFMVHGRCDDLLGRSAARADSRRPGPPSPLWPPAERPRLFPRRSDEAGRPRRWQPESCHRLLGAVAGNCCSSEVLAVGAFREPARASDAVVALDVVAGGAQVVVVVDVCARELGVEGRDLGHVRYPFDRAPQRSGLASKLGLRPLRSCHGGRSSYLVSTLQHTGIHSVNTGERRSSNRPLLGVPA